jgi:S-formylglutathione hydrolase
MGSAWTKASIAGKTADVYDPPGRARFGLLYLHGVGLETLRDNPIYTSLLAELNLACICPHGGPCWWADRLCPEFDPAITAEHFLVHHVIPYFKERWGLTPPRLGVLGVSMGGQGALRLAFKHPAIFPAAAGIASALDYHELYGQGGTLDEMYDSKEQCRQDTALLHVPPSNPPPHLFFCIDPDDARGLRGNDRLHEKLTALGVAYTVDLSTRAGGHTWAYFNHMAETVVRFLDAALEQESRRLL